VVSEAGRLGGIVGESETMKDVFLAVERVAPTTSAVLVQGESGTGKEMIARAIHYASPRADRVFLTENCAALSESVIESELFGHVRGAFTGAEVSRAGIFQMADRGTLFLDEIGDMSLKMQGKLLRVLQEGEIRPVGGKEILSVDVRIISATNHDLRRMMERGEFREDLYYRLNVFNLHLPPLRERKEDVPALVDRFLEEISLREHGGERFRISRDALVLLLRYSWPGNIRELRNVIERAMVLCQGRYLRVRDLPEGIVDFSLAERPDRYGKKCAERVMIETALVRNGGNKARASAQIGWNRPKLYRRMRKLGIELGFGGRMKGG
jgi:transcriptional regulator with PAS, ATPase and Fis domain